MGSLKKQINKDENLIKVISFKILSKKMPLTLTEGAI